MSLGKASGTRLTPFEVGQIKAHAHHELSATKIRKIVRKSDGSPISVQGVADVMAKLESDPSWRGERAEGAGRRRETSKRQDKAIVNLVYKKRGTAKLTVALLKRRIPSLKSVCDETIRNRLHEAGLAWMRRRKKTLVPGGKLHNKRKVL